MIATSSAGTVSTNNIFPSTAVSDAFEAVTNGMHNPEALEQLAAETGESSEWFHLIYAVQAFYRQDFAEMNSRLDKIPDDCTAAGLKKVLSYMSGSAADAGTAGKTDKLSYREEKLAKRVTEDSRFLASAIEQLRESIEYGEELFVETVSLLIKEIKHSNEAAERLALWSFRFCIENDFDDEALADNIMMLFGQAEGLRLIGLSLLETEPESALICFTRSLIKKIVDMAIGREQAAAYLEIIGALLTACEESDPVMLDISELLSMLESELRLLFSLEQAPVSGMPAQRVAAMIASLAGDDTPPEAAAKPAAPQRPQKKIIADEPVQLELF